MAKRRKDSTRLASPTMTSVAPTTRRPEAPRSGGRMRHFVSQKGTQPATVPGATTKNTREPMMAHHARRSVRSSSRSYAQGSSAPSPCWATPDFRPLCVASQAELAQVVVGVLVGPPLPVGKGHRTEEPMRRIKRIRLGCCDRLEPSDCSREIGHERGGLCATCLRVVHRICRPTMRPWDRRPQSKALDCPPVSAWHRLVAWSSTKHHAGGVTEVTEHLVRCERAPVTTTVGLQRLQPRDESTKHSRIGHSPHGPMLQEPAEPSVRHRSSASMSPKRQLSRTLPAHKRPPIECDSSATPPSSTRAP